MLRAATELLRTINKHLKAAGASFNIRLINRKKTRSPAEEGKRFTDEG
jgi:hypothetical protein